MMSRRVLVDSHCHVSGPLDEETLDQLAHQYIADNVQKLCLMSMNHIDYEIVNTVARHHLLQKIVIPSFGIHPWFAHLFTFEEDIDKSVHYGKVFNKDVDDTLLALLPNPISIQNHFEKLKKLMLKRECLLGEVGLDKLFRIPSNGYFGNVESNKDVRLTNYKTTMSHQKAVLEYQLIYAFESNISLSVHNVKAMGVFIDLVRSHYNKSKSKIMLHSYTGSIDSLKLLISLIGRENVYITVSWWINGEDGRYKELVETVDVGNVLIESDISVNNQSDEIKLLRKVDELIDGDHLGNLSRFCTRL